MDLRLASIPEAVKHAWQDFHLVESIKVTFAVSGEILRRGSAVAPLSLVRLVNELDEERYYLLTFVEAIFVVAAVSQIEFLEICRFSFSIFRFLPRLALFSFNGASYHF